MVTIFSCHNLKNVSLINIFLNVHSTIKIPVERVNQEKRLVKFAANIKLAGNQQ